MYVTLLHFISINLFYSSFPVLNSVLLENVITTKIVKRNEVCVFFLCSVNRSVHGRKSRSDTEREGKFIECIKECF